ncbi:MAG: C1 family peptidase [bacterium]
MLRLALLLLAALAAPLPAGHRLGLIPEDLDTVPGVVRVDRIAAAPCRPLCDTVVRVDHSANLPPVGNQGGQGSCVAWAHGYYHMTHNEFVERGWNVRDPRNQFSPAFLYNQVNGGQDGGTSGSRVMVLAIEQGCATLFSKPYNPTDYSSWPSEAAYFNALEFRGEEACFIAAYDTAGINRVRQHLANGYTGVIGIRVWENFDNIHEFRHTYCSSERYGTMRGWHAVTIVGYDDTLPTSDGPGAFRVVNSWGTGWGDAGFFWMSYVAVMDAEMGGRQVEYLRDRVDYRPVLVGLVTISHPTRDRVGIELGVAPVMGPPWSYPFRSWRSPARDFPFPGHPMVFDLTEGAEFLAGNGEDRLFLGVVDDQCEGATGSITGFSVEHLDWGTRGVSGDPPVAIPDDGEPVFALAQLPASGIAGGAAGGRPGAAVATIVRGSLSLTGLGHDPGSENRSGSCPALLLDISGRMVMELLPGDNDVRHLAPGVYFVRRQDTGESSRLVLVE